MTGLETGNVPIQRVAFVTGGSRGIGRAICAALAAAGHKVALCYSGDEAGASETCVLIEKLGSEALAVKANVTDVESVDAAFKAIEAKWGEPVTILVNNAGITHDGLLMRMKDEQWQSVIDTNLTGAFYAIRRATPGMMKSRWGRIVNVSSVSGQSGAPAQANYSAAKAGMLGLARAVARELAPRNVTCNVVAPGPIETAMTADLAQAWRDATNAAVPLGRFGTPQEVAAAVAFCCSEGASYMTGALIPIDGGLGMGH